MPEFVLGTGHQRSVRNVCDLITKHIVRTEGIPRLVEGRTHRVKFTAERDEFKGPFQRFCLWLPKDDRYREPAETEARSHGDLCSIEEEDGALRFEFPPAGTPTTDASMNALDKVSMQIHLPEVWNCKGDRFRLDRISVELLFQAMVQYKASDVHLSPGASPIFRVDGQTRGSELMGELSAVQINELIREIAEPQFIEEFEREKQTSFNFHQVGIGYSRVSAFLKSGAPHCTLRFLPEKIPSFEDLSIPRESMERLANLHRGLLLITGMTGSGKTTTVAALVDWINEHRNTHILCIENPIEYVHMNRMSMISQRSIGVDVENFNMAVTGALRHDPDVILIGEMRDPDTIRAAINAAATGHLVISTLHANTASEVVNRIVSFFNPVERDLVKLQLRDCLQCVICQRLIPKIGGGRVPALEFMFNDVKAIADGILEGDTDHIRIGMQQTVSHSFLFEQYIYSLFKKGLIDNEHAKEFCTDVSVFEQIMMGTYSIPRLDAIRGAHS